MRRFKDIINIIVGVIAIASTCLSIYNYFHLESLQQFFDEVRPLELQISIDEPQDGSRFTNYVVPLKGKLTVRMSQRAERGPDVNVEISERGIEIVPFVRPLSETNLWYAQTKPTIISDGTFMTSVNIGDKEGHGIDLNFHIVVLALPKGIARQGFKFVDLPTYGSASRVVTVKRVRNS